MPHYYFDVSDDVYIRDEKGAEVADASSARARAIKVAVEAEEIEALVGGNPEAIKVIVRDENERRVLTVKRRPRARRS